MVGECVDLSPKRGRLTINLKEKTYAWSVQSKVHGLDCTCDRSGPEFRPIEDWGDDVLNFFISGRAFDEG